MLNKDDIDIDGDLRLIELNIYLDYVDNNDSRIDGSCIFFAHFMHYFLKGIFTAFG